MKNLKSYFLIALACALSACSKSDKELSRRTNELLAPYLKGQTVHFVPLKSGEEIRLPDLISVAAVSANGCLSLGFARTNFEERFLRDLFYSNDSQKQNQLSPFTEPGVHAILTADHVVLNLYAGVIVRLIPDAVYSQGYSAFKSNAPVGKVLKVVGAAEHVAPRPLPESLSTFLYLRNGKAFALQSSKNVATKNGKMDSEFANSFNMTGLRFHPAVVDRAIEPYAVACVAESSNEKNDAKKVQY